jgi:hypothetical protein
MYFVTKLEKHYKVCKNAFFFFLSLTAMTTTSAVQQSRHYTHINLRKCIGLYSTTQKKVLCCAISC